MNLKDWKALNPRQGELVLIKYKGFKNEIGQIASGNSGHHPIFDEKNNLLFVHFIPQSYPSALDIGKIEDFQLISQIPLKFTSCTNESKSCQIDYDIWENKAVYPQPYMLRRICNPTVNANFKNL